MTKEVEVKNESADIAVIPEGAWGVAEQIDNADLIIPKIYHQQSNSKFVGDGVCRPGDFVDSITGEVLALKGEQLDVIIFDLYKSIVIERKEGERWEYQSLVKIVKENAVEWASKPLFEPEETSEGLMRYRLLYNFYCLIAGKIDELPYLLTLGSTKTKAARKISTITLKLAQQKRPSASIVFGLTSEQESNEKGSWFGIAVSQARSSTQEELTVAYQWYKRAQEQKIVAYDPEGEGAAPETTMSGDPDGEVNF